jgi:putative sterol carrier protein
MADTPTPEAYFAQVVPQQYAAALAAAPAMADQPPLSAVFEIAGAGGGIFSARTAGAQIEVQPGDMAEQPDMRVIMSYDDWRTLADSGATDSVVDYVRRCKVSVVQGLKGTVMLELTRSDNSLWHSTIVFGGQAEPALTVMMSNDDYQAMLSGELNSQMAFLTGKLKFEGSLPLLMQIGALAS